MTTTIPKTLSDVLFEQEQEKEIISLFQKQALLVDLPEYKKVRDLRKQLLEAENTLNLNLNYVAFKLEEESLINKIKENNYNKSFDTDIGKLKVRKAHERLEWDTARLAEEARRDPTLLRFKTTMQVSKSVSIDYL